VAAWHPDPPHEFGVGRELREVAPEIGNEASTLAPRQVAERQLDGGEILLGAHRPGLGQAFGNWICRSPLSSGMCAVPVRQRKPYRTGKSWSVTMSPALCGGRHVQTPLR